MERIRTKFMNTRKKTTPKAIQTANMGAFYTPTKILATRRNRMNDAEVAMMSEKLWI
jgi:hypothetical protein